MKRLQFILIVLFCIIQIFIIGQETNVLIKGTIVDKINFKRLENVNILSKRSYNGTISKKNGYFSLFIKSLPDTIQITHVSYETKDIIIAEPIDSLLIIELIPKVTSLDETVIIAKKSNIYNEENENHIILDYTFINNNLILLQKKLNSQLNNYLIIVNEDFDTLSYTNTIPKKSRHIYKDCINYYHLLTKDSAYQISFSGNSISFLKPVEINKFYSVLKDCLFESGNNIFFKEDLKFDFGKEYYAINTTNKKPTSFIKLLDTTKLVDYLNNFSYLTSKYWGYYIPAASVENDSLLMSNIRNFENENRFSNEIVFKPIYNRLVHINDTIIYFNHLYSSIQIFSPNLKLVKTIPIEYHKNNDWQSEIIKDNVTQKVYTLFKTNSLYSVYEILVNEGKLKKITDIPYFYPEKIKINNDRIYFLHKKRKNSQTFKKLNKLKI